MTNLDIRKLLSSQFGASYHVGTYPVLNKMSTGIIGLDQILGGGVPMGRLVQIWGGSSSCKTTVCLHIAKAIQSEGHHCAFVDAERTLEVEQRSREVGLDVNRFHYFRPSCGEQAIEFVIKCAEAGMKLVIVDSVPCLLSKGAAEADIGTTQMAPIARLLSAELPKLIPAIEQNECLVIFINQTRNKIGGYGDPTSLPGGGALSFYSSVILKLARTEVFKDGSGVRIAATTTKNKYFAFGKKTEFNVSFPHALVDKYSSMKETLQQQGLLLASGSFFKFNDELKAELGMTGNVGQGVKAVINYLQENPAVYTMLYQRLLDLIKNEGGRDEVDDADLDD